MKNEGEVRVSMDGTVEPYRAGLGVKLPKSDPMIGATTTVVERISIIDGSVERVKITVLSPFQRVTELPRP